MENKEPLPIWLFVGVILAVYGVIVVASSLIFPASKTVLADLRPGLWWGSFMTVFGLVFVAIGLSGRSEKA